LSNRAKVYDEALQRKPRYIELVANGGNVGYGWLWNGYSCTFSSGLYPTGPATPGGPQWAAAVPHRIYRVSPRLAASLAPRLALGVTRTPKPQNEKSNAM